MSIYILENLDVCFRFMYMIHTYTMVWYMVWYTHILCICILTDVSKLSVEISVLNEYLLYVFISTCFGSLTRFSYEYMMFSCLKSFKIANKGLIKNHSFQSWVASADSKSTWRGCTVKYYLLFFRLLCFIKLTLMAFRMKNIFLATSNFKFFNFTCRYVFSNFFFRVCEDYVVINGDIYKTFQL